MAGNAAVPVEPILVWPFYEAPEELQALSQHEGDEDWLAKVPKHLANEYIAWLKAPVHLALVTSRNTN